MSLNDIQLNASRFEIAGKNSVACDLFFLIEHIVLDTKSKFLEEKRGLLGVPYACFGGIESQGKEKLHVHMIAFSQDFLQSLMKRLN